MARRLLRLLVAACVVRDARSTDLQYPTPANPFAKPSGPPDPTGATPAAAPLTPPTPTDELLLPGGDDESAPPPGARQAGDEVLPPLPGSTPPPGGVPSADGVLPMPGSAAAVPSSGGRRGRKLRPTLCLVALSAACVLTRPREPSLLIALDAHHERFGHMLDASLREDPVDLINAGIGCLSVHSELVWLGILGQWLPLLPAGPGALGPWMAAVGAPALLLLALTFGYALRKLMPRRAVSSHLSVSCEGLMQRGRVHTLLTSAFSPVGLVHWAHALAVLLVSSAGLEGTLGRGRVLGLFAGAGAASAFSSAASQLVLGRRHQPRSAVSGAVLGVLLARAAAMPEQPLAIGSFELKPLRAILLHILLDMNSNSLPTPPRPIGVEKLFALLGAALLVAVVQPSLRDSFAGALEGGWDWRNILAYVRDAL